MKKKIGAFVFLLFVATLFYILYNYDNKYQSGAPYGKDGTFTINESNKQEVMFLIDDWQFYGNELLAPNELSQKRATTLFIGQYPSFKFIGNDITKGTYRMKVVVNTSQSYSIKIPEIFNQYQLYINETMIDHTTGDIVSLQQGSNDLTILVVESNHYYSGIVYPIMVGRFQTLARMQRIHDIVYAIFIILSFTLAVFTLLLRKHNQNKLFHYFGMLCISFGIYSLYPFLHDVSTSKLCYAIEDGAFMMVILYISILCTTLAKLTLRACKRVWMIGGCMVVCSVLIPGLLLPCYQEFITYYGGLVDAYKIGVSVFLFYCVKRMIKNQSQYSIAVATCSGVFALSLLCNLVFNNLYEPIYTVWQSEYALFFIMLLFFYIINRTFAKTLEEHRHLSSSLEEKVHSRTREMQILLEERKAFFSDVAHDLKAPLSAIQSYTQLIENNNLYVDKETTYYLQSIERKNKELIQRVSVLNELTKIDKISQEKQAISVNELMQRVYDDNVPESDALGIYYTIMTLDNDVTIYGVPEKMRIVFENLFYNSLGFMPNRGNIKLSADVQGNEVILCFEDSGEGIASEHLPFIFERFYSARKKRSEESGLGLYIAKMIVTEMSGHIWAESQLSKGTKIFMKFPIK